MADDTKVLESTPVSVSLVVLCDLCVLVNISEDGASFPFDYLRCHRESAQDAASRVLTEISGLDVAGANWIPVDVRSIPGRENPDGAYSVDIGYLTIVSVSDLPELENPDFKWHIINLDQKDFPLPLVKDHDQLWAAAYDMFNLMR